MSGTFNPPANPTVGQIYTFGGSTWRYDGTAWVNANTGANFLATTGGTMTGPLVLSGNAPAAAPLQAVPLQQVSTAIAAAPDNVGRNLLHNGLFNIWQRGTGPFTSGIGYTADRWRITITTDTVSLTQYAMSDADRTAIGDEAAKYALTCPFTGSAAAGAMTLLQQSVEDVHRLSGKTITVSFWARYTAGTPQLGVSWSQIFGSGGSPSAAVVGNGVPVTLTGAWARYNVVIAMPSVVGKTLGTSGSDCTNLDLWFSSSSGTATRAGIGVQSGTIQLWGLQLEIGSVATPLEKLDPQMDLSNCQRFFTSLVGPQIAGTNPAGVTAAITTSMIVLPVTMRASPTVTQNGFTFNNCASVAITAQSGAVCQTFLSGVVANTLASAQGASLYLSADL